VNGLNLVEKICSFGSMAIPDEVWYHPELKPTDIKLYKVLMDYGKLIFGFSNGKKTSDGEPIIDVSQQTLGEKVGVSDKTIQKCLARLKKVKLIDIDDLRGFKRNNLITLIGEFFGIKREPKQEASDFVKKAEQKRKEVLEGQKQPKEKKGLLTVEKLPVVRKSIKRVPIKIPFNMLMEMKLREMGGYTSAEKRVIEIAEHYDMLVSKHANRSFHRSLPKEDKTEGKHWKSFMKLYDLCKEKGWDPKLFLEVQFTKAKRHWKKVRYPFPNMLCSENAQKSFERHQLEYKEKYKNERFGAEKAQETISLDKRIIKEIMHTASFLPMYTHGDTDRDRQEAKAIRIFDAWEECSPFYLWSIPWFDRLLKEQAEMYPDNKKIKETQELFAMINKSKRIQKVILAAVEVVERKYDIPKNIDIGA